VVDEEGCKYCIIDVWTSSEAVEVEVEADSVDSLWNNTQTFYMDSN